MSLLTLIIIGCGLFWSFFLSLIFFNIHIMYLKEKSLKEHYIKKENKEEDWHSLKSIIHTTVDSTILKGQ